MTAPGSLMTSWAGELKPCCLQDRTPPIRPRVERPCTSHVPFSFYEHMAQGQGETGTAPRPRTDPQGHRDLLAGVLFMVKVQTPVRGSSEELQAMGLRSDWPCQRLESAGQARIGLPLWQMPRERRVCDRKGRPRPSGSLLKTKSFPQQPRTGTGSTAPLQSWVSTHQLADVGTQAGPRCSFHPS